MNKYSSNNSNKPNVRGILIEQDAGFIEPTDKRNEQFITELNKIGTKDVVIAEPLKLFVVLQKYGVKNKNGRIYPEKILKREADNYNKLIQQRSALGESDHPDSTIISNSRVSHEITKIWWEGKTLVGEIEILMSPGFINYGIISCEGDNVANFIRKGIRVGVSSRGVGTLENIGGNLLVGDDFELICWDIVINPSTPGSWMFQKREEATPFMESDNSKEEKSLLIDNIDKFLL